MTTGREAVGSLGPGQGSPHAGTPLSGVRPADGAGRPARPPRRRASAERRLGLALIAPAIIALSLVTLFPLIYNLWNSFHTDQLANPAAGKGFSGLQNYRELFNQPGFTADFVHTAFFTVVSVGIEICLGLAIAVVISKPYRGRGFVRAAILVPWAVPTVVSAMLWKTMVDPQSGFVNYLLKTFHLPGASLAWSAQTWSSWAVVIVSDAWKTTPLVAIILLAGLQAIPDDVYEAAQVDGAGAWRRFTRITLPLLKPALLVALIFRTLAAFLVFDVVYILTGGGPGSSTETLGYLNWKAFLVNTDFGFGGAVSVSLILMALLIAFGYNRLIKPSTP